VVVVEGGKCPTPCKREGKLSGKEKFPGGGIMSGVILSADFRYRATVYELFYIHGRSSTKLLKFHI